MGLFTRKPHDCNVHGHQFEPRYDVRPNASLGLSKIDGYTLAFQPELVEKMVTETIYVHDVCVKCGKVVNRD